MPKPFSIMTQLFHADRSINRHDWESIEETLLLPFEEVRSKNVEWRIRKGGLGQLQLLKTEIAEKNIDRDKINWSEREAYEG